MWKLAAQQAPLAVTPPASAAMQQPITVEMLMTVMLRFVFCGFEGLIFQSF